MHSAHLYSTPMFMSVVISREILSVLTPPFPLDALPFKPNQTLLSKMDTEKRQENEAPWRICEKGQKPLAMFGYESNHGHYNSYQEVPEFFRGLEKVVFTFFGISFGEQKRG